MKNLEQYMAEYQKAISGARQGDLVVEPEVWILARWEMDNEDASGKPFGPWSEDYLPKLEKVMQVDPRLYQTLCAGIENFSKSLT